MHRHESMYTRLETRMAWNCSKMPIWVSNVSNIDVKERYIYILHFETCRPREISIHYDKLRKRIVTWQTKPTHTRLGEPDLRRRLCSTPHNSFPQRKALHNWHCCVKFGGPAQHRKHSRSKSWKAPVSGRLKSFGLISRDEKLDVLESQAEDNQ